MLDRLTIRSRRILEAFSGRKTAKAENIVDQIIKSDGMGAHIIERLSGLEKLSFEKNKSVSLENLVKKAYYEAIKEEHSYVGSEHLLCALLRIVGSEDYSKVKIELIKSSIFPSNVNNIKSLDKGKKTPTLDLFGESVNQRVLRSEESYVKRDVYDLLVSSLLLEGSSNILLVGENGVGKKTLVEMLASNINSLEVPPALAGVSIIEFDMFSFMTNSLNKGNIEISLMQLIDELRILNRVILYIKNFQNIFFSSNAGISTPIFFSMFKSALDSLDIKIISSMNTSLFDKLFAENEHLIEDFTIIEIPETNSSETKLVLEKKSESLSEFHHIKIEKDALDLVYQKSKEMPSGVGLPKKAVALLDHCCSHALLKKSQIPTSYKKMVDQSFSLINKMDDSVLSGDYDEAVKIRSRIKSYDKKLSELEKDIFLSTKEVSLTKSDVLLAVDSFSEKKEVGFEFNLSSLVELKDKLKQRIIGQEEAIDIVVKNLIRYKMGLKPKKRPLGNFLFLGPTGVGKTEFAKILAESFYGEKSLIRLDMSDFAEKHTVARLVGAPPGYVGYGEGGELTTKIENKPNSVVLFDEIEKAHPDVLNILLQITEEGELVDARGSTFDFSKSIVVLTSNLGTEILHQNGIGFEESTLSDKTVESRLKNNLKKILKPELINRFDEIVIFKSLKREEQYRILELLLSEVYRSLSSQDVKISVSSSCKKYLLEKGYSKEYGARGLRRSLEREFLDKIADYLLKNSKRPLSLISRLDEGDLVVSERKRKNNIKS